MTDRVSDKPSTGTICVRDTEVPSATATQICLIFFAAAQPKGVVTSKYIARLCVRIVIVSQNYRAAFVTVRACYCNVEILMQILLSTNMKFGKKSSNMFTSFALKHGQKKEPTIFVPSRPSVTGLAAPPVFTLRFGQLMG
jgi:hypothetical protein